MLTNLDPLTCVVATEVLVRTINRQLVADPRERDDFVEGRGVDGGAAERAAATDFKCLNDTTATERVSKHLATKRQLKIHHGQFEFTGQLEPS